MSVIQAGSVPLSFRSTVFYMIIINEFFCVNLYTKSVEWPSKVLRQNKMWNSLKTREEPCPRWLLLMVLSVSATESDQHGMSDKTGQSIIYVYFLPVEHNIRFCTYTHVQKHTHIHTHLPCNLHKFTSLVQSLICFLW